MIHPIATAEIPHGMTAAMKMVLEMGAFRRTGDRNYPIREMEAIPIMAAPATAEAPAPATVESGNSGSGSNSGNSSQSGGNGNGQGSAATPDDVILWGISSRYIDESELYNYSAGQLRLIRNEIFALHGRIFRSQDLRDYFSQKSWYVPTYDPDNFDANMFDYLNDYEAANLKVILNYEAALAGNSGGENMKVFEGVLDKITAPAACDWYFRRRCRVLSGEVARARLTMQWIIILRC